MHRKLEEGGECRRGARVRIKVRTMGLAQTARLGIVAGESKTKVGHLGSRLNWNMSFATERRNTNRGSLERVAHVGSVLETTGGFQGQVQRFQSDHAGRLVVRLARFLQDRRKLHRE